MRTERLIIIVIWFLAALLLLGFFYWGNHNIVITQYEICSKKIHKQAEGFVVAQVSDLHGMVFGRDNVKLLNKLRACAPDIIVITGDLVDERMPNSAPGAEFVEQAIKIAPVYYVSGNHESVIKDRGWLMAELRRLGAVVLEDASVVTAKGIVVAGMHDLAFLPGACRRGSRRRSEQFAANIHSVANEQPDRFRLLLSHRPEYYETYVRSGADLVLCGHAHGGQFRLPFIGGLFAPGQGLFPKYTEGAHTKNGTTMIVSRGLGGSVFPIRLFNRPELVVVTLRRE